MTKELCDRCSGFGCWDCKATGFAVSTLKLSCRFCNACAWHHVDDHHGHKTYRCGSCNAIRWFHPKKAKYVQERSDG